MNSVKIAGYSSSEDPFEIRSRSVVSYGAQRLGMIAEVIASEKIWGIFRYPMKFYELRRSGIAWKPINIYLITILRDYR